MCSAWYTEDLIRNTRSLHLKRLVGRKMSHLTALGMGRPTSCSQFHSPSRIGTPPHSAASMAWRLDRCVCVCGVFAPHAIPKFRLVMQVGCRSWAIVIRRPLLLSSIVRRPPSSSTLVGSRPSSSSSVVRGRSSAVGRRSLDHPHERRPGGRPSTPRPRRSR